MSVVYLEDYTTFRIVQAPAKAGKGREKQSLFRPKFNPIFTCKQSKYLTNQKKSLKQINPPDDNSLQLHTQSIDTNKTIIHQPRGTFNVVSRQKIKLILSMVSFLMMMPATLIFAIPSLEDSQFFLTEPVSSFTAWESNSPYAITEFSFSGIESTDAPTLAEAPDIKPEVSSEVLIYPNPFKVKVGAQVGYQLSKDMDVDMRVFNMLGQQVFQQTLPKGTNGGFGGDSNYNKVDLNQAVMAQTDLPTGVYFIVLMNEGKVLKKGKCVIES